MSNSGLKGAIDAGRRNLRGDGTIFSNPLIAALVIFGGLFVLDSFGFRYSWPIAVLVGIGAALSLTH